MSEKMKQLRQYMKDNRGSEKTIQNSLLAENTQYEKNNYFTLLAVILQQVDNIPSGQLAMYKRLVAGASVEHSVEEYLQKHWILRLRIMRILLKIIKIHS